MQVNSQTEVDPGGNTVGPCDAAGQQTTSASRPVPLIEFRRVGKSYTTQSSVTLPVLSDIDLRLEDGEILGLLGRSGSGKSTILRLAAGLLPASSGQIFFRGEAVDGPLEGVAMVFQTFALYPWLSVTENVELGLDALPLAATEKRRRVHAALELIGLDGFQSAYPRELSGGMRQRVGFARAIACAPTVLLMDEPFSALDVLTADILRTDFLDVWAAHELPTRAVLLVTHNIEEAVWMCDRILVLGARPGHIVAEIEVPIARPRNRLDEGFHRIVDEIYGILTARLSASADEAQADMPRRAGLALYLPPVASARLADFVETLANPSYDGEADLATMASRLALKAADLLPLAAALQILCFADLKEHSVKLTTAGRAFARSDADVRKRVFREHLLHFVPLAAHIRQVLDERETHGAPRQRFELELQDHLHRREAELTLRTVTDWGRYAGLFSYDDRARVFHSE
jgi:NitT/TauT family transport system ATP-binding protein